MPSNQMHEENTKLAVNVRDNSSEASSQSSSSCTASTQMISDTDTNPTDLQPALSPSRDVSSPSPPEANPMMAESDHESAEFTDDPNLVRLLEIYNQGAVDFNEAPHRSLYRTQAAIFVRDTIENLMNYIRLKSEQDSVPMESIIGEGILEQWQNTLEMVSAIAEKGCGGKKRRFESDSSTETVRGKRPRVSANDGRPPTRRGSPGRGGPSRNNRGGHVARTRSIQVTYNHAERRHQDRERTPVTFPDSRELPHTPWVSNRATNKRLIRGMPRSKHGGDCYRPQY